MNEIADLMKEYFASKEKLSSVIAKQEEYAQRMMDDGYLPTKDYFNEGVVDLLQSIHSTTCELLDEDEETNLALMTDSLLHILSCVSHIRVKLGLPPSSFSKPTPITPE